MKTSQKTSFLQGRDPTRKIEKSEHQHIHFHHLLSASTSVSGDRRTYPGHHIRAVASIRDPDVHTTPQRQQKAGDPVTVKEGLLELTLCVCVCACLGCLNPAFTGVLLANVRLFSLSSSSSLPGFISSLRLVSC